MWTHNRRWWSRAPIQLLTRFIWQHPVFTRHWTTPQSQAFPRLPLLIFLGTEPKLSAALVSRTPQDMDGEESTTELENERTGSKGHSLGEDLEWDGSWFRVWNCGSGWWRKLTEMDLEPISFSVSVVGKSIFYRTRTIGRRCFTANYLQNSSLALVTAKQNQPPVMDCILTMFQALCSSFCTFSPHLTSQQPCFIGTLIIIVYMGSLRRSNVMQLAQGHTHRKQVLGQLTSYHYQHSEAGTCVSRGQALTDWHTVAPSAIGAF